MDPVYVLGNSSCTVISGTPDHSWANKFTGICLNSVLIQSGVDIVVRYIHILSGSPIITMTLATDKPVATIQNEFRNVTYAYIGDTRFILGGTLPGEVPAQGVVFVWNRIADVQLGKSIWSATHAFMTDDGIVAYKVYVPSMAGITGVFYSRGAGLNYIILDSKQIVINPLSITVISGFIQNLQNQVIIGGADYSLYLPISKIAPVRGLCEPSIDGKTYLVVTNTISSSTVFSYKSTEIASTRLEIDVTTCRAVSTVPGIASFVGTTTCVSFQFVAGACATQADTTFSISCFAQTGCSGQEQATVIINLMTPSLDRHTIYQCGTMI